MQWKFLFMVIAMIGGSAGVYAYGAFEHSVILAQDPSHPATAIGALAAGFTLMTALLAWVVKRLLDTTIPEMQKDFHTSLAREHDGFAKMAELFQLAQKETREGYQQALQKMQDGFLQFSREQAKESTQSETTLRDLFDKKMQQEREFFDKELQAILGEFRIDRERFFDALITAEPHDKKQGDGGRHP